MISMNKRTIERHVIGMIISLRLIIPKVRFKSFRMWPTGIPDAGECSRSSFFISEDWRVFLTYFSNRSLIPV